MSAKEPLKLYDGEFIDLYPNVKTNFTIELVLEDIGRIGVRLSHAQLESLYQHILSAADQGQLDFDLLPQSGGS